jgi:hypothetical protein
MILDPAFQKLLKRDMTRKEFLTFSGLIIVSIFGIAGVIKELASHATTPTASVEPEDGTPSTNAKKVTDSTANSGIAAAGLTTADLTTVINGDLLINDAYVSAHGTTLDKYWVKGHVYYTAATAVKLTRSQIQGRSFTAGSPPYVGIVHTNNSNSSGLPGISLDQCTIFPVQPDVNLIAVDGARIGVVNRCNISLGSDGLDFWAGTPDATATGNYFGNYSFWSHDGKHTSDGEYPGWSHNDLIQISGATKGVIKGNAFHCFAAQNVGNWTDQRDGLTPVGSGSGTGAKYPYLNYGGCITLTASAAIQNITIDSNWFYGGRTGVIEPRQPGGAETGNSMTVTNNRFDWGMHGYGPYSGQYSIQMIRWGALTGPVTSNVSGNKFMGTDAGVPSAHASQALPAATLVGAAGVNTSQYLVSVNTPTQPVVPDSSLT